MDTSEATVAVPAPEIQAGLTDLGTGAEAEVSWGLEFRI